MKKNIFKKGMASALAILMGLSTVFSAVGVTAKAEETPATYTVAALEDENGSILLNDSTDSIQAKTGDVVTIQVTPDKGYQTEKVIALDSDNKETELKEEEGYYEVTVDKSDLTIVATIAKENIKKTVSENSKKETDESAVVKNSEKATTEAEQIWGGKTEGNRKVRKSARMGLDTQNVCQFLGINPETYLNNVRTYTSDGNGFYLGTPYPTEQEAWTYNGGIFDFRSPNGDPWQGYNRLNCTGFVWYLLNQSGGDGANIPNLRVSSPWLGANPYYVGGWSDWMQANNIKTHDYATKEEMLNSGELKYGDIIWVWDEAAGKFNASDYHHIGVYIGDGNSDALWSSNPDYGNSITEISGKAPITSFTVVETTPREGALQIVKSSANSELTDGNPNYTLSGAVYGLYSNAECTEEVARLTTGADGKSNIVKLPVKTYYLKEITAPKGYVLNKDVSTLNVVAGETTIAEVSDVPEEGYLQIVKSSTNPELTDNNPCYSLSGAVFGLYSDAECKKEVSRLTTGADGKTGTVKLPMNTYYLKEITAPKGYLLNKVVSSFNIVAGKTTVAKVSDVPGDDPVVMVIKKLDKENGGANPQGDGTLANAEFTIKYYNGFYDKKEDLPEKATRTWVMKTRNDGVTSLILGNDYKVSGDDFYYINDRISIPLGTITIEETKAPAGYLLPKDGLFTMQKITMDPSTHNVSGFNEAGEDMNEQVIRGGVQVIKSDKELDKSEALGGKDHGTDPDATRLSDIEFTIKNASANKVLVEGTSYQPGDVITTIRTHWNKEKKAYTAEVAEDYLPYGTYSIQETKTNESYILTDGKARTFEIRENKKIVTVDTSKNELNFKNLVVRGDFSIVKIANSTSKRLSVPFVLENVATGEKHVFVTDRNGEYSSAASWNKHTDNTNGNDKLMDMEEIKASDMDSKAGMYFGLGENGSTAKADDSYGALPYGKYKMTELRCENNAGYGLQEFEFYIYKNNHVVECGTLTDDEVVPEISTTAIDKATNSHIVAHGDKVTVIDTVHCEGLIPGNEYKLTGTLMDATDEGESMKVDGKVVKATTTFVAERVVQDIDVTLTFNSKEFGGKTGVVFEKLYFKDKLLAEHTELTDEKQTVYFPGIKTSATDVESGTQNANPDKEVTIVDKVHYTNLIPNEEYKVKGTLMDKSTKKPLLVDKKEVTAEKTFTPETAEGDVELTFTFDGSALVGKTIVAFESLSYEQIEVAVHEDIEDKDQSIFFPEIHTTAVDAADGDKSVKVANPVTITDTITYKNLIPGNKYRFVGTLMDKETETALRLDGKPVMATAEFTAKEANGTIEVDFTIDATTLNNRSLVVFEKLFVVTVGEDGKEKETEVGKHEDITDEGQTVDVNTIEIHTEAKDKDTNSHNGAVKDVVTIGDTVTYVGLKPGTEYIVKGTLMDKATGKPIQNDDKDVTAQTTFTPTESDGSIDVTFRFNGSKLGGTSVVVFEKLFLEGKEIAHHEDLNDEKQTVVYKAEPNKTNNKTTPNVKTGDNTLMTTMFLLFILVISIMGTVLFRNKKMNK